MLPSRVVFVDVYIDDPNTERPSFRVLPSPKNKPQLPTRPNPDPQKHNQPEIIFGNNGHKGFQIHFELQGDTHGYFFPSNEHDAVWSQRGRDCPDTGVWDVFSPLQVESGGHPPERRTLIVENPNPPMGGGKGQGKFMYNLRVTDGSRTLNLDPPGDNTNGSVRKDSAAMSLFFGGAVATAAFAALANMGLADNDAAAGTALLASLALGFGIAALWERLTQPW